ncbi:putative secreted protein [Streptomyces sp. L-9-10]|nr:putative secreted protein [Streptomyces sp. L-9-10]
MRRYPAHLYTLLVNALVVVLAAAVGLTVSTQQAQAATVTVQAESYAAQSGVALEATSDTGGGQNASFLADGDWMRFDNVDLGAAGRLTVSARIASAVGSGTLELRTAGLTGPLLAVIPISPTGGWQNWATRATQVTTHPTGSQTVFAVLRATTPGDFVNINWFSFVGEGDGAAAGWVPVDQAKWNAQLAQFRAMTPAAVPAGVVRVPEFNATCTYSHSKPDDPIVFPGLPGASHMHSFFGNKSTDAFSTTESLLTNAPTSCTPANDLSAYWIPTLYENDKAVEPEGMIVYYGSRLPDPSVTVPFPQGFRMIAGDARAQTPTPAGSPGQFWCAGAGGEIGRSADGNWPRCAPGAHLTHQLVFPDCWDGKNLDSPDHKSHVAFTYDGKCSGAYPVAIPNLSFVTSYPTSGSTQGFRLASGMPSSIHGDFFNAWDNAALGHRVKDCITQKAKCNSAGTF